MFKPIDLKDARLPLSLDCELDGERDRDLLTFVPSVPNTVPGTQKAFNTFAELNQIGRKKQKGPFLLAVGGLRKV